MRKSRFSGVFRRLRYSADLSRVQQGSRKLLLFMSWQPEFYESNPSIEDPRHLIKKSMPASCHYAPKNARLHTGSMPKKGGYWGFSGMKQETIIMQSNRFPMCATQERMWQGFIDSIALYVSQSDCSA